MNVIGGRRWWVESASVVALLISAMACNRSQGVLASETPAEYDLPVEGSKMDLGDLDKFLKGYTFGNSLNKHNRDASDCKACVEVEIQSIGLTTDIDETNAPAKARVVARMQNNGQKTAVTYLIQPQAKADYYIWVDRLPSGKARWTIVELNKQTGGKALVHLVVSGSFERCAYTDTTKISEADFKSCASAHPETVPPSKASLGQDAWIGLMGASVRKVLRMDHSDQTTVEDPAWIRCAYGCCTASKPV